MPFSPLAQLPKSLLHSQGLHLLLSTPSIMHSVSFSLVSLSVSLALVAPQSIQPAYNKRDVCIGNTASDRSTWCSYSTSTDYYTTWPDTGVTRDFYFSLQNITASPDGVERIVLTVNGSVPGPTIEANWLAVSTSTGSWLTSEGGIQSEST